MTDKDEIIEIRIRRQKFSKPDPYLFSGKDARIKAIELLRRKYR